MNKTEIKSWISIARLRFSLCLLFFVPVSAIFAQRIQNFNVYIVEKSVGIKFSIAKGSQCNGYTIWHSLDSLYFSQLYNYPGICGDASVDQDYSYTHTYPTPNVINYYKIELTNVETSPVKRIYVTDQPQVSMIVYPNPVVYISDLLNIKVLNAVNLRLVGFLYNQYGKPIRSVDFTTQPDLANIYVNDLENGMYVIWLTDGTSVYSTKFIVNR